MGRKDKNKKKISGSVKTALKTEKKLNAKQKKELAALGEEDIEKVIAEIEREEARKQRVVEAIIPPPSRRVNFTLVAHPFKDELIMYGGEYHDGQKTSVYGDMFMYALNKKEWTVIKVPNAPPPRCGHQAIVTATNKGEMWIFGGEFSSPSESQFYHYKDLWVYRIGEKKWEKILSPGGPSARSGHRMVHMKKKLFVFGGFYDNLRDCKYYNDIYMFNLEMYTWHKIETTGNPPAPRSGCIMLPASDKLLVYGGYSKEKVKSGVDKGCIYTDMFSLVPDKNDQTGLKWKWNFTKQSGIKFSPRCGLSAVLVQSDIAYIFGGVFDDTENEEELQGTFFNDLMALDLKKNQWHEVVLSGKKESVDSLKDNKLRKEIQQKNTDSSKINENNHDNMNMQIVQEEHNINTSECSMMEALHDDTSKASEAMEIEDDVFTLTVNPVISHTDNTETHMKIVKDTFSPPPRINAGLVVKHNVLYLYGGLLEDGDRQYTLNDFYSLDCRKLDEWKIIIADDLASQDWVCSSSSDSEDDEDTSDDDSSDT